MKKWSVCISILIVLVLVILPVVAVQNGKIAFASNRDSIDIEPYSPTEIYIMNPDGTDQIRLTTSGGGKPKWSPDGTKILFGSGRDGNNEIYVMNADGTQQTRLTISQGSDLDYVWSPDGTKIAFTSDRDGNSEIYVMNADGTHQTRLTNNQSSDIKPVWSPDGSKIAFTSDRDGNNEIYVMNADGIHQTRLTNYMDLALPCPEYLSPQFCVHYPTNPAWSPDGTKIAFILAAADPYYDNYDLVYEMDADGSDLKQLFESQQIANLVWSPDGNYLALNSASSLGHGGYFVISESGAPTYFGEINTDSQMYGGLAWSPDSMKLVTSLSRWEQDWYVHENRLFHLYLAPPGMTSEGQLTYVGHNVDPDWGIAPISAAQFTANPTTGPAPLSITFSDKSTFNPIGWAWYFGDETFTTPWTQRTASAQWAGRWGHTSVVLPDGSIVLMGGRTAGDIYKNDVWRSTNKGASWTLVNASAEWTARVGHTSVVMPDGSIVLMGGSDPTGFKNDVWWSMDKGNTWRPMRSAGWTPRIFHTSVVMPDRSIVLMGGYGTSGYSNDVWRSINYGETWTQMNASAGWAARYFHSSVTTPDGNILLMGGSGGQSDFKNDVWRSKDNGATWARITAASQWSGRYQHSSVVMPDGSIMLMSGTNNNGVKNDVWRSTDNGAHWSQLTASAGWSARFCPSVVVIPDGSIVLTGGSTGISGYSGLKNDVWRLITAGSSQQNPTHIYTKAGTYQVTLQAYNSIGYKSTRKVGYIVVKSQLPVPVASFTGTPRSGPAPLIVRFNDTSTNSPTRWNWSFGDTMWFNTTTSSLRNASHTYTNAGTYTIALIVSNAGGSDSEIKLGYITVNPGPAIPVAAFTANESSGKPPLAVQFTDQSMTGITTWSWDFDHDGSIDATTKNPVHTYTTAGIYSVNLTVTNTTGSDSEVKAGYITVSNIPTSKIGVFRPTKQRFYLDATGDGMWGAGDSQYVFGLPEDLVVSGDWNKDGITEIGVFRPSKQMFYLDYNGNGAWNGAFIDRLTNFGLKGDLPVTGDWNRDGYTEIGVFRPSKQRFYLDAVRDGEWGAGDTVAAFGLAEDLPVAGDWNKDGKAEIGVFRPSKQMFYLDYDGNGVWSGTLADRVYRFGKNGDIPVAGDWNGDGKDEIGVFRPSTKMLYLDKSGNGAWGVGDTLYAFGLPGDLPVAGVWG